jgi:hypothetical protein
VGCRFCTGLQGKPQRVYRCHGPTMSYFRDPSSSESTNRQLHDATIFSSTIAINNSKKKKPVSDYSDDWWDNGLKRSRNDFNWITSSKMLLLIKIIIARSQCFFSLKYNN